MTARFEIGVGDAGERLDLVLPRLIDGISRSAAQRIIEQGGVAVNGVRIGAKKYPVAAGDTVEVELAPPEPTQLEPQDIPLDIVYEDGDVIVVNKPRGMVVHPAAGHRDGTLVNALMFHCGDSLSGIGGELRPGIVHRIDKDTSGLIIAAKNDFAHTRLAEQLASHSLSRVYEAVVYGNMREDSGTVDAPLGRHPTDRKRRCVGGSNPKRAVTHWQTVRRYRGYTHIRCTLETGRTHQIRVHMEYIGHPIIGDLVYGPHRPERGLSGQCLHAGALSFTHPRTSSRLTLTCPLPEYFTEVIAHLPEM